eukprot:383635_1
MWFLFAWIINIIVCESQTSDCAVSLKCKWSVDNYELDLTPFQIMGYNLTTPDTVYDYHISICNNLIPTTDGSGRWKYMAAKTNKTDTEITYLGYFDGNVKPTITFNENSAIKWHFQYSEYPFFFALEFICDFNESLYLTSYMKIIDVIEVLPNQYKMSILSYYVCQNVTVPYDLGKNQCIWYDETNNSSILDLRSIYGQNIRDGVYNLVVCENKLYPLDGVFSQCSNCCGMYGSSYIDSIWDPSVKPVFDSDSNTWSFMYSFGANSGFLMQWICDPKGRKYHVIGSHTNFVKIVSKYACPPNYCVFMDKNDNMLDLSNLTGIRIGKITNNMLYQYTPCTNNVGCNGKSVMAMRWDIEQRKCDPYLAEWDGFEGYTLSYNQSISEWHFKYTNGETCNDGSNTQFDIYFTCNSHVTKWNVTNIEAINNCLYVMYIDSIYAC